MIKELRIHLGDIMLVGNKLEVHEDRIYIVSKDMYIASFPLEFIKHNLRVVMVFNSGNISYRLKDDRVINN